MNSSPPLILVDGSSYLYRAYHALPPLANTKGQPTGAIKGVIGMLRKLMKDYENSTVIVVFDAKGKTFRDDLYAHYKANRPPMPDDLRSQIEPIHQIIKAMGLPLVMIEGVEADDVIGTLAIQASQAGQAVVISTGDKDMAQLVDAQITLVNTMSDSILDIEGVNSKFGVPPSLIIDLLALMGDKVDNIPGVPGVGEKTAMALLQSLGGLNSIYQDLEAVAHLSIRGAKSLADKLAQHKDNAYLSYQLATIKTDVSLPTHWQKLVQTPPDANALAALYTDLEFKGWVTEISENTTITSKNTVNSQNANSPINNHPPAPLQYATLLTEAELIAWMTEVRKAPLVAVDTETTSLNYRQARIVGISMAIAPGRAVYIPFGHDYLGAPAQLSEHLVWTHLKPFLEEDIPKKIGQHIKYDAHVFSNHGIYLRGIAFDTMMESYVLNSLNRHNMDALASRYLNYNTVHFEDIAGRGQKQLTFNQIELEKAAFYAAEDADITLKLHQTLWPQIVSEETLNHVFNHIELPLIPVLQTIEANGTLIDVKALDIQSRELAKKIAQIQNDAYLLVGREFNLSSPKQLADILFNELKIPTAKKTATGAASTSEEVLQELSEEYELPRLLLQYRSLAKLKSTYTDKLAQIVEPKTGRVHTSYHQAVAATGRLSSSDPNLQNIPIRTEEGRRIRQAFIAPPGFCLMAADYSQIELRIMAHLSQDPGLLTAFSQNLDVHKATAAEVFGVTLDQVTTDQRRSAKAINFGLIYGMSAFGLAKQLHISRGDAQKYIDLYFDRYPGVKRYMDTTRARAAEMGYVETLSGRRLYLPDIRDRNPAKRQAAERTAINAPMQGSAADIIKLAMLAIDNWIQSSGIATKMIMQVHDELVLEVHEEAVIETRQAVAERMSNAMALSVPLLVEIGVGQNWDQAH